MKEEVAEVVGANEDRMPHLYHLHTGRATVLDRGDEGGWDAEEMMIEGG